MIRNILAVIAGNVGWTILWLSYNAILKMAGLIPSDTTNRFETPGPLLLLLVGSVVFSVLAGFITTVVARGQSYWPAIILCGVQLALGIFFQLQFWKLMPIWYHLSFLLLLAPATVLGAWIRLK
ncbi:MAG: hypothetical protein ABI651_10250 [Verrucomicrobiota bacterium]